MAERLKLGQLLVQMAACSPQDVEDALNNQVIYGGTVGTNLLELGRVTEPQLAAALGRLHGLPFHAGEAAIAPEVVRLMSRDLVERTEMVPFQLQGHTLEVLIGDPTAVTAMDEVAFATGKKIVPIVAAEERVWSLMLRLYRIDRQFRALAVDRPVSRAPASAASAAPVEDLMSQEEFDAMYSRERDAAISPAQPDAAPPATVTAEANEEDLPEIELLEEVTEGEVAPAPAAPIQPAPLTFAEAEQALAGVANRDAIAQVVLRYACSKFKRSILLAIRGGVADGWEGLGEGITPAKVRNIRVRLTAPSVFQTVASAQAHYLGPMLKTPENLRFLKTLAGGAPKTVFVIPILVRGRVVNALYADNGRGGLVDPDVGELLILAAKISQSYDALLSRRA